MEGGERYRQSPLNSGNFLRNPQGLRRHLEERGALCFTPYESGLFPASNLTPEMGEATGMGMAWLRDNAHVIMALYEAGYTELSRNGGNAMLTVLKNNEVLLDTAINSSFAETIPPFPVRVEGNNLNNDIEPRVQNDSIGYLLWCVSRLMRDEVLDRRPGDLERLDKTIQYIDRYWEKADEGHWEEDRRIHSSSIGVVLAGLESTRKLFEQVDFTPTADIAMMQERGAWAFYAILSNGVTDISAGPQKTEEMPVVPETITTGQNEHDYLDKFSVHHRKHDGALLFLVEPLGVLTGEFAEKIVTDIEDELQRKHGIARYTGDTYWEPRFPSIMDIKTRTTHSEESTEKRNLTAPGIAYTQTEAQWTLFDPLLSVYYGKRYLASGDERSRKKQLYYLDRSLNQLNETPDGRLELPEAYYYEYKDGIGNHWIPNTHSPLLWSQANLLRALNVFEATSGD